MVPAGAPVDQTIQTLEEHLSAGDIIIDGGNSYYKDTVRRGEALKAKGIFYLDAGTSGGVWGLKNGYCLMVGGDPDAYKKTEPIFLTLAPEGGLVYTGASGSGHLTKMVHNGIEYGMLQSYGEGFEILGASEYKLNLAGNREGLALRQRRALVAARSAGERVRGRSRFDQGARISSRIPAKGDGRFRKRSTITSRLR